MEPSDYLSRRRFLTGAGLSATSGLAGCSVLDAGGDDGGTATATATATATETPERPLETEEPTATEVPLDLEGVPADALGCAHVGGQYDFTDEPFLAEGADVIGDLGMRTIRIFDHRLDEVYPFDHDWPEFDSMLERYQHPALENLFSGPFDTYYITSYSSANTDQPSDHYWHDGVTDEQFDRESQAYYDVASHVLDTYDGTGKTFVFSHWEGDWSINDSFDPTYEPGEDRIQAMIRWLNARQEGIERAREEVDSDVTVLHDAQVNLVRSAMTDGATHMVNSVVPEIDVNLVSYSCYEVLEEISSTAGVADDGAETIQATLEYIEDQAPEPGSYAQDALGDRRNVFIGEFGWPLVGSGDRGTDLISLLTRTALSWGAPWAIYWQLYGNELREEVEGRPDNGDVQGYYLVRPDGTKAEPWSFFRRVLDEIGAPAATEVTLTP